MRRREFIHRMTAGAGVMALKARAASAQAWLASHGTPAELARDVGHWTAVQSAYDVDSSIVNLENAYWGVMARPVEAAYFERVRFVNHSSTAYVRDALPSPHYSADLEGIRGRLATLLGCQPSELALTRSGAEALQNLLINYRGLGADDAVIYADLDYESMQLVIQSLAQTRGVRIVGFAIPEPATRANVLEAYDRILRATPRARLLWLTHLSNRTGLVLPVAEIAQLARARGVDVILDAAQSIGQIEFAIADLGVDFAGFSLHKWIGAPLGTGCLYIKRSRLEDISPHLGNRPADDIRSRVFPGTANFAAFLTVEDALAFQTRVGGVAVKEARLRYLRDYWVSRVRELPGVAILTPDEPALHAGLTSFRVTGLTADRVQQVLFDAHRVLTVARKGIAKGDAVRVTPALFTSEADLDRLVAGIRELVRG
jgi:selenocysteine lyase/cysteine desulfurase